MSIIDLKRTWAEIDLEALAHTFHEIKDAAKAADKNLLCGQSRRLRARRSCALQGVRGARRRLVRRLQPGGSLPAPLCRRHPSADSDSRLHAPAMAGQLDALRVSQAVYSLDYARELSQCAVQKGIQIKKPYQGGYRYSRALASFYQLSGTGRRRPGGNGGGLPPARACSGGIFTHFAVADEGEAGRAYTQAQYHAFCGAIDALPPGVESPSLSATAPTPRRCWIIPNINWIWYAPVSSFMASAPSTQMRCRMDYRPVMTLKASSPWSGNPARRIWLSYGRHFTASRPMTVGTVPISYADGYPRRPVRSGRLLYWYTAARAHHRPHLYGPADGGPHGASGRAHRG